MVLDHRTFSSSSLLSPPLIPLSFFWLCVCVRVCALYPSIQLGDVECERVEKFKEASGKENGIQYGVLAFKKIIYYYRKKSGWL